nr:coronatine-insensitive protein 1 [Ipomoea batatas]GMD80457.1 coronatine-insensitive protein 1 [Ipomoea batatas]GME00314.1 coronatine-insensitive protein 1 [Ipomoea batatas]
MSNLFHRRHYCVHWADFYPVGSSCYRRLGRASCRCTAIICSCSKPSWNHQIVAAECLQADVVMCFLSLCSFVDNLLEKMAYFPLPAITWRHVIMAVCYIAFPDQITHHFPILELLRLKAIPCNGKVLPSPSPTSPLPRFSSKLCLISKREGDKCNLNIAQH